jgi:hypothetical protein
LSGPVLEFTREDLSDIADIKAGQATMNGKLDLILSNQERMGKTIYGEDGRGGLCEDVSSLKTFRNNILIFVGSVSGTVSLIGTWLLSHVRLS